MKKYKVGYTQGCFDMFHIGHLNLFNRAKQYCDYLVVGVNSDELVESYKGKKTVVNQKDRLAIVQNIKAVDSAVIATTLDKLVSAQEIGYDAIFIGDDWRGSDRWEATERDLASIGIDVVYLPYTEGISSTALRSEKDDCVLDSMASGD